jgi:23S rRNA pseudouridine2605 synthase
MEQRLQKILAGMGVSSRRKAEELIIEGRVTVNGSIASIGMKADASKDHIKLDGKLIKKAEPHIYLMFNKPRGVLTSMSDPEGRPTISDYLKGVRFRVFPIGRLDYDSEGLLLLTNDGDLSHAVLHPSRKIPKTYVVKVKNVLMDEKLALLRDGIRLEDGITAPAGVKRIKNTENNSWIEMTIYEGRKRQIRRMLEKLGHPVMRLRRIAVNGLKLMGLEPGQLRTLTAEELETLKREVLS